MSESSNFFNDYFEITNRRGTDSFKWDFVLNLYGEDILPMWVADMDFKTSDRVIETLLKRAQHGIFGYTYRSQEYYDKIISWYKERYGTHIEREWIVNGPGVVPMIALAINVLTQPGDKIIIQPPVYPPFFRVVENNGRRLVKNYLKKSFDGNLINWEIDFENLEKIIDDRTKLIIISNPHNPVGRVWTKEELQRLYEICLKYNITIISDEIHSDFVYHPNKFVSFLDIGLDHVIVFNSPGKTFNIAGLTNAYGIIPDKKLRNAFKNLVENLELLVGNIFSIEALKAAYSSPEWVHNLITYLKHNRDYICEYISEHMPILKFSKPQGTYLLWVDCSLTNLDNPQKFFLEKGRIYLSDGAEFGDRNFIRINFACPLPILREGLERMKKAYDSALVFEVFKLPDERFEICKKIREEVFVKEQGIDQELEIDGKDTQAIHFILKHFSTPIGVARARDLGEYWKVERVAVLKNFRKFGYGKRLMEHIEFFLENIDKKKIVLNAQKNVKDFYLKIGYEQIGNEFLEAGISHVRMEKVVKQ
ncbi:MAG: PatB family C-S lyase [Fervidobacterium sp.]